MIPCKMAFIDRTMASQRQHSNLAKYIDDQKNSIFMQTKIHQILLSFQNTLRVHSKMCIESSPMRKPGLRRASGDSGSRGFLMSRKVIFSVRLKKKERFLHPELPVALFPALQVAVILLPGQVHVMCNFLPDVVRYSLLYALRNVIIRKRLTVWKFSAPTQLPLAITNLPCFQYGN